MLPMKVASWNVRTLGDSATSSRPERGTALVARELDRYDIDIAALSETRLADEGQLTEKGAGYTFYWKGLPSTEPRQSGVGFAIRSTMVTKLANLPRSVSDRLMYLRLPLKGNRFVTIVSAYAPTMSNSDVEKERFYSDLDKLISSTMISDKLVILGDFNARVGKDEVTWRNVIGRCGVGNANSNGTMLLSACSKHSLAITNTFFRLPHKRRTSWMHPRSKQWHLIDYVITRQRDLRDVHITEAMRGADCWTDHRLIRSKVSFAICPLHRKSAPKPNHRLNVNLLKDPCVQQKLSTNMSLALSAPAGAASILNVNHAWTELRDTVYKTSLDTLGKASRRHQDWFDENDTEVRQLLSAKQQLHCLTLLPSCSPAIIANYKECCHNVQTKLRDMRDRWWVSKASEIQGYADRHETKEFYSALKTVYGPTHSATVPLYAADGTTLLSDKSEILLRWKQHFSDLLNMRSSITDEALNRIRVQPECSNLDLVPTLAEVTSAINAMKNGKAPGSDAIPAEVYKFGGPELRLRLLNLFVEIWLAGDVPQDFKDATIVTIYKRKGNKSICGNYRGISLLSIAGKILTRILLVRLLDSIAGKVLPEAQCGFRPKRGTSDMIFAARQIQEKCREQHNDLYTVFIDLTKAFDTVSRDGLWKVLRKFGCTEKFTKILQSLHDGMLGRVSIDGTLSEHFPITNGVRQGCIAGPILFNLFYAAMLDDATRDTPCGISIRFRCSGKLFNLSRMRASSKVLHDVVQELLYADDCALEAHSQQDIQLICDSFAHSAARYGLTINLQKTEVMYQPAPGKQYQEPKVLIGGALIKPVTDFCYLGSTLSNDVQLDKEIANRISKASTSFGRLTERVWKQRGLKLQTKIKVYNAVVLSNLLYGCETWTCYRRHIQELDKFHMRHLRSILGIKWQDKVTNTAVLERSQCTGVEALLISSQLRWAGHVMRMEDSRIPKQLLYGELAVGTRSLGGPKKRFKDTLKHNLKMFHIDAENWEAVAADRPRWRASIFNGRAHFEHARRTALADKRQKRKQRWGQSSVQSSSDAVSTGFICDQCGLDCHSRIGLLSHSRRHRT